MLRYLTQRFLPFLSGFLLVASVAPAWGHSALEESRPAAGSTVAEPPETLELVYAEAVNLVGVDLSRDSTAVDVDFQPSADAARRYEVPLPSLEPGRYRVQWTALGADGHRVQESFEFVVE